MEQDDEKFMTPVNLIRDYLGMQKVEEYNETTLNLLAGCVDQTKDGYVHEVPKKYIYVICRLGGPYGEKL